MNEADVRAAMTMWERHAAIDLPRTDLERALRQLPESGVCAVSDDATALFMLSPTDTLFTASVQDGRVTLTSRPLDADRLAVGWESAEERSRWTFRYVGEPESHEPWQAISGSVVVDDRTGREQPDDREQFARALASRAGWTPVQSAPPPSEESEPDEPRWRARTDVWGQPLDVRRR
jgi:hypothetical protein